MKIILHTKNNVNFWAADHSSSETLIKHLIGTRYVDNELQMENLYTLAKAHGWGIEIKVKND
jgi:hypothetical protein